MSAFVGRMLFTAMPCQVMIAGLAYAECAWVSCEETTESQQPRLRPPTSADSPGRSVQWQREKDAMKSGDYMVHVDTETRTISRMVDVVRDSKSFILSTITKYLCLPDTIDPRGPKGRQ